MDFVSILLAVLSAAGLAAGAAGVGYLKAYFRREPGQPYVPEPFEPVKFTRTILIGMILGGIAGFYGISPIDAEFLLESMGIFAALIFFVDTAATALVRFVRAKLKI